MALPDFTGGGGLNSEGNPVTVETFLLGDVTKRRTVLGVYLSVPHSALVFRVLKSEWVEFLKSICCGFLLIIHSE